MNQPSQLERHGGLSDIEDGHIMFLTPRPLKAAANRSSLSELLRSADMNADDAVTTRERLRHRRRDEMRQRYEATIELREANDQSRHVICNKHHQQLDVAPSVPDHPLVDNLLHGAYYEAKEPVPDMGKPRGLGKRVPSAVAVAPTTPRPLTVAEQRRAAEEELAKERALVDAMMKAPRAGNGLGGVRPFPQDDAHDYWGRKVGRAASAPRKSQLSTFRLADPDPPPPRAMTNVPPMPGFDMAAPDQRDPNERPSGWCKPLINKPVARPPEVHLTNTLTQTDPDPAAPDEVPPPLKWAERRPALSPAFSVPTCEAVERVAQMPITEDQPPATHNVLIGQRIFTPNTAPVTTNPVSARSRRFQSRPMDTVKWLF